MKRFMAIILLLTILATFAATGAAEQQIILKVGFSSSMEDSRGVSANEFKKEVEEKSNGSVKVEIYPGGQLGGDAALIESITLDSGLVDIIITDAGNINPYEPQMGASSLPFLLDDFDMAWAFMDSDLFAEVEEKILEYNLRVLAHYCNGFRCMTTSKVQINTPEDMKGLLIRTPENPILMDTLRALGANPQPLAFSELYMALQQNTYDGQENPIPIIFNNKLYEVQKYLSVTNHVYSGMVFAIADSTWNKMSEAQQEIVKTAAKNSEAGNRELNRKMTEELVTNLEEAGMVVTFVNLQPFKDATKTVMEENAEKLGLKDKINQWLEDYSKK